MIPRMLAAGLVALIVLGSTGVAVAAPEDDLADRYAPVLRLVDQPEECGAGEPFVPSDVDAFLGEDTVSLRGPWTGNDLVTIAPTAQDLGQGRYEYHLDFPGNPLAPGCDYERWAETLAAANRPTTYAHVVTEPGRPNRLALQYWFFYPFNDYNNKHEGDWEMIQLLFAADDAAGALSTTPVEVAYSQHEGAERADWDDPKLEVVDGTHPVVHVAAGSHANNFDSALFLGRSAEQGVGCDDTREPASDVRPAVRRIPTDPEEAERAFPWIAFEGRWGERQEAFYNGPTGPNMKSQWTEPVTYVEEKGRDHSYAVPAGGLLGTDATEFFCDAIGAGSDALRKATDKPGPALLAASLLTILLVFIGVRTTWRPSAPLRLARRRAWGQTVTSAARMYASRPRLFVGIGLLTIPVSVVVAVLQSGVTRAPAVGSVEPGGESGGLLVSLAAILGWALMLIAVVLVQAATTHALADLDAGHDVRVATAYRAALPGLRSLLAALAVAAVTISLLGLTVVLAPVAIWLAVSWALFVPVSVLEHHRPVGILRRSAVLVRHRSLAVAWLLLITAVLVAVPGPVLGVLLILATDAPLALANVVAGVMLTVLMPFAALTLAYACADARVREALGSDRADQVLPAET